MGWDAFASFNKFYNPDEWGGSKIQLAFEDASKKVREIGGIVDGFLPCGGLDFSDCGYALEEATGEQCWVEKGWDPAKVHQLFWKSRWANVTRPTWVRLSAYHFLRVCNDHNLGVHFSW